MEACKTLDLNPSAPEVPSGVKRSSDVTINELMFLYLANLIESFSPLFATGDTIPLDGIRNRGAKR